MGAARGRHEEGQLRPKRNAIATATFGSAGTESMKMTGACQTLSTLAAETIIGSQVLAVSVPMLEYSGTRSLHQISRPKADRPAHNVGGAIC